MFFLKTGNETVFCNVHIYIIFMIANKICVGFDDELSSYQNTYSQILSIFKTELFIYYLFE